MHGIMTIKVRAHKNMEKYVKKLVDGYDKFTGSDLNVQKTPDSPGTTLIKS